MALLSQVAFPFDAYNYTTFCEYSKKNLQLSLHIKSLTWAPRGPSKSQAQNTLKKFKKMFDRWLKVCYTVPVMSENAYLTKPTQHDARMEIASAEGSLEFIVDNIGTEWCNNDDIQRVLSDAIKALGNAREISRDAENA